MIIDLFWLTASSNQRVPAASSVPHMYLISSSTTWVMAQSVPTGKFVDDSKLRRVVGTEFQSRRSLENLRTGANRNLLIFGKTEFKVRNYDGKSCTFV